jgi:hypothetical protein
MIFADKRTNSHQLRSNRERSHTHTIGSTRSNHITNTNIAHNNNNNNNNNSIATHRRDRRGTGGSGGIVGVVVGVGTLAVGSIGCVAQRYWSID